MFKGMHCDRASKMLLLDVLHVLAFTVLQITLDNTGNLAT